MDKNEQFLAFKGRVHDLSEQVFHLYMMCEDHESKQATLFFNASQLIEIAVEIMEDEFNG